VIVFESVEATWTFMNVFIDDDAKSGSSINVMLSWYV